jgi:hypothetical protein
MATQCRDCSFFGRVDANVGVCHRSPPPSNGDTRPVVACDDWCGEFKAERRSYGQATDFEIDERSRQCRKILDCMLVSADMVDLDKTDFDVRVDEPENEV